MTREGFVSARVEDVTRNAGDWIFVDIGFAQGKKKTCGVAFNDEAPRQVNFANLTATIIDRTNERSRPLHLLIEAPLSVAFDADGNPTGRTIERRGSDHRYWYDSSGCRTMVATTYLLREIICRSQVRGLKRQVRLVEGFYSFKSGPSPDVDDVARLRTIVWQEGGPCGRIVQPSQLKANPCDIVTSAFAVAGMDFGVPPVVEVCPM